ncbi:hypothetical protein LPB67_07755 [Undibacterium sp. Jales W-56]|uniref:hypothetical protein n=1 Tax=Undibacterium sp. Jales W-56 TaxID=2897325 RepID=UPI0021D26313|nr:hypothetical protein [Undibacterium sp. Jales W-56]MCU6433672.1 hypothetical protein [Undibacterium sp. Jales W-56]
MKLACKIQQSRHGVYYYRHQFTLEGVRKEHRFSLQTKNSIVVKEKFLLISSIIIKNKRSGRMQDDEQDILKRTHTLTPTALTQLQ